MNRGVTEVAAGILLRPDGAVLLGERPAGKVYAGYWEFPGGKVEAGESATRALQRELEEELSIRIEACDPWLTREFTYPHATVLIRFFRVWRWQGEPRAAEHRSLRWQRPGRFDAGPMLPANAPILRALEVPAVYAVSDAARTGTERFLEALERALAAGLRWVQLREKTLPKDELLALVRVVAPRCAAAGAQLLLNSDPLTARCAGVTGLHLTAERLMQASARPDFAWVGASCHERSEIERAAALGLDYAVLGPVRPTPSHPDARVLGWEGFERTVRDARIPVFAIGGMHPDDLSDARSRGAHGVAMISAAWGPTPPAAV